MAITIFTDGSSRGNPGPGGWGAIIRTENDVFELGGRENHTTNNRMELMAAIEALGAIKTKKLAGLSVAAGEVIIVQSDSKYVIKGITEWVSGWKRNGWKTAGKKDVENRDLWEALDNAKSGLAINWKYVQGHAGHPGNERCDEIATSFADKAEISLYSGAREKYPVDLDAAPTPSLAAKKKKSSSSAPAHSYVSYVNGVLNIDKTWKECEARVKGVRGAKFKKSTSVADEKAIIKEWTGK